LQTGVSVAGTAGKDILLLRPGTYTTTTIAKPLTIRAATQPVIIQKP
jgi:hypothetical protein